MGSDPLCLGARVSLYGGWLIHVRASSMTFNFIKGGTCCMPWRSNEAIPFGIRIFSLMYPHFPTWWMVYLFKGLSSDIQFRQWMNVLYTLENQWGNSVGTDPLLRGVYGSLHGGWFIYVGVSSMTLSFIKGGMCCTLRRANEIIPFRIWSFSLRYPCFLIWWMVHLCRGFLHDVQLRQRRHVLMHRRTNEVITFSIRSSSSRYAHFPTLWMVYPCRDFSHDFRFIKGGMCCMPRRTSEIFSSGIRSSSSKHPRFPIWWIVYPCGDFSHDIQLCQGRNMLCTSYNQGDNPFWDSILFFEASTLFYIMDDSSM